MAVGTRLSSKGQVVIPARVRQALGWRPGERLSVEIAPNGERAVVLRGRSSDDTEALLARGYDWLERSRHHDMVEALHASRRRARARERRRR